MFLKLNNSVSYENRPSLLLYFIYFTTFIVIVLYASFYIWISYILRPFRRRWEVYILFSKLNRRRFSCGRRTAKFTFQCHSLESELRIKNSLEDDGTFSYILLWSWEKIDLFLSLTEQPLRILIFYLIKYHSMKT
jgi:hypothetical protein